MKKSVAIILSLFLFLGLFVSTSSAVGATLFGPKQCLRTTGQPDVYDAIFSATPGVGTLIVTNGDEAGNNRLSSSAILLNGEQVLGPDDLNQEVYLLQFPVTIAENNTIDIEVTSIPLGYLTITVIQDATQAVDPPTVTITAVPTSITLGETSTLSWSSTDVDTVTIDNSIGDVAPTGSFIISPTSITTYTIAATNASGTATSTATIAVIVPPTVTISATPTSIVLGEATLTWAATNADTVTIDNGIGSVGTSGSITVSLTETTTYTITATGPGGTATDSVTVTVVPVSVSITSPGDGQIVSEADIIVQGIFSSQGAETGVSVNGRPAEVSGNQFFLNHVSLIAGENIIEAVATDVVGNTATASVSVISEPADTRIELTINPESGISLLGTKLRADLFLPNPAVESSLSGAGPAVPEITQVNLTEYDLVFNVEGIYILTYVVTDDKNNAYQQEIMVNVLYQGDMDNLLKAKWAGMKTALSGGDIAGASNYLAKCVRDMYLYNFNLLSPYLADISASLQDIKLVDIKNGAAEYEMLAEHSGQTYSFYILFVKDSDGIWRIQFF